MEHDSTLYVGPDVHKESITAAYALGMGEVELLGKVGTTKTDIDRLCKRLQSKASRIRIVYEAGPCGYGLYRQLQQKGVDCMVCAPSLIPRKPGERVKTDRRDAIKLVRSLRAGDLSEVYVPTVEDGAFRDLARAWVSAKDDLKRARQRLKSFLLSHGVSYSGDDVPRAHAPAGRGPRRGSRRVGSDSAPVGRTSAARGRALCSDHSCMGGRGGVTVSLRISMRCGKRAGCLA